MKISDSHLEHWLEHGYAVVENFLTADEVAAAITDIEDLLKDGVAGRNDSVSDEFSFPFSYDSLNHFVAHPDLLDFVERAIGTDDIRLKDSVFWPKHAGAAEYEQGLHLDWDGDTLVCPRDDGLYRQVTAAVYYTDVTADLGPTQIVSKQDSKHMPLWPASLKRAQRGLLREYEHLVVAPAGSLLLWGPLVWHGGSGFKAKTGHRYAQFLTYAASRWAYPPRQGAFRPQGGEDGMRLFIEKSSPRARQVVGFPGLGDPYWNEQTLELASLRYPGLDITPYREGFAARTAERSLTPAG